MAKQSRSSTAPPARSGATNNVGRGRQDAHAHATDRRELNDFLMYYDELVGRTYVIPVAKKAPPDGGPRWS